MKPVKHIRISDPYVIERVELIRMGSNEPTASKAAGRLIIERAAEILERPATTLTGTQPISDSDARKGNDAQ
jgi:hypothetical protein